MIAQNDDVSVDENFVRFAGKSYAINKINSVEVREKVKKGTRGYIVFWGFGLILLPGMIGMISDGQSPIGFVIIILACALFGFLSFRKRHNTYTYQLFLMTSSGEAQALTTNDRGGIMRLRELIENAMTRKYS